jgi:hypothetical protein
MLDKRVLQVGGGCQTKRKVCSSKGQKGQKGHIPSWRSGVTV